MRKKTAIFIVLIFLIASLSGCGSQTESSTTATPEATTAAATASTTATAASTVTTPDATTATTAAATEGSTQKPTEQKSSAGERVIGIAWYPDMEIEFISYVTRAVEETGGKWVMLAEVKSADVNYAEDGSVKDLGEDGGLSEAAAALVKKNTWQGSNAEEALKDVDFVIFPGGEDISPTLFRVPGQDIDPQELEDYNVNRDVSDYLTMSYCLDKDIPVMGICRGMQMLAIVSGAEMLMDIPTYFANQGKEYNDEHRNPVPASGGYRDYRPHDVTVAKDSLIYNIVGEETINKVPSWHHVAVKNVDGTKLVVTGYTETNGLQIIEALERTDKTCAMGIQFHPEAAVGKNLDHAENAGDYISKDKALAFFKWIVNADYLAMDEAA